MAEPMIMSSPYHKKRRNQATYSMTSLLDIVPTVLDWFNISDTSERLKTNSITPSIQRMGKSLLPLLSEGNFCIKSYLGIYYDHCEPESVYFIILNSFIHYYFILKMPGV